MGVEVFGRDVKLLYYRYLTDDEKVPHNTLGDHRDNLPMSLVQSYQWVLLAEISQLRASADHLHRRLASLCAVERACTEEEKK